ncbi:Predicted transposase YbfD/YdcC associated with H repeats [Paenibacillus algorifonticola]|uniref:Predicted transposase YbfD/YdcC associated with H repeats n=2 Tax=Paenibacillus algorifonticola TaxID=684063 RepID=A0A1I2BRN1_9BACL|nr:Predicted transposase YbfD/YdcC associated with H repeats [Paenibacillus algorifonticola]
MSNDRYQGTFFEYFSDLQDNRQEGKVYHRLTDILFIVVSGVLCGYYEWDDIYTWAKVPANGEWFEKYITLMNGIPSLSTIKRGFSLIQPQEFLTRFIDWMSGTITLPNKDIVSVDGKTSRGSKGNDHKVLHIVSALCHSHGLVVGQTKTDEKSNEITAIPVLLEQLMIKGCIVTMDAMGAQKKILEQIVDKNKADYVVNLKGNQGTLHKEVQNYFVEAEQAGKRAAIEERNSEESTFKVLHTVDQGHGRIEKRTYYYSTDLDWMGDAQGDWAKLTGVSDKRKVAFIADPTKTTTETAYYISSVDNVTDFATAARKHWGIESMHWSLDVTFGDDRNQTRETAAAQNLAVVKRMVFNVLKNETKIQPKTSKPNKRVIAAADVNYRDHLINMAFHQM